MAHLHQRLAVFGRMSSAQTVWTGSLADLQRIRGSQRSSKVSVRWQRGATCRRGRSRVVRVMFVKRWCLVAHVFEVVGVEYAGVERARPRRLWLQNKVGGRREADGHGRGIRVGAWMTGRGNLRPTLEHAHAAPSRLFTALALVLCPLSPSPCPELPFFHTQPPLRLSSTPPFPGVRVICLLARLNNVCYT